jgi:hypothetical protein
MHIYLDESGGFITPSTTHRISAIAALVLPDARRDEILQRFQNLERSWQGKQEAKGNKLTESQVQQVIQCPSGTLA